MIRQATLDDMDWLLALANEKYEAGRMDDERCRAWLPQALGLNWMLFLRGEFGAGVASITAPFYDSKAITGHLLFVASRVNKSMEAFRIVRLLSNWAFEHGARAFAISNGTGCDLTPFAKRLGAIPVSPMYHITRPDLAMEQAA